MSLSVEKFLYYHGKNYPHGISLKTKKLPWLFIYHNVAASREVLEAAITKGLHLVIGDTAQIVSPDEALQLLQGGGLSYSALVEVGGRQILSSDDGHLSVFNEIIPSVSVLELNENDESKKKFWKILKSLAALAL